MTKRHNILLLNGPNLNLLGRREPEKYGSQTLEQVVTQTQAVADALNIKLEHLQSNAEHELINAIHNTDADFIIINPAALTHTSIALRDALLGVAIPFIELHISNVHARESFRHSSYLSDIAVGVICGLGTIGYELAVRAAMNHLSAN